MKKLIVTLAVGDEAETMADISVPLMQAYARRTGADFELLGVSALTESLSPFYEKMQIHDRLDAYDVVLFLDADILVTPWATDVFDVVPDGHFAAVSVEEVFQGTAHQKQLLNDILGDIDWRTPYFNSGVFLARREHQSLFNTTDGLIERWIEGVRAGGHKALNDQNVLNYRLNASAMDIFYLDNAFNFTRVWKQFDRRFDRHFIHYAGFRGDRVERMRRDARIMQGAMAPLYRSCPLWVKVSDKVWEMGASGG